MARKKSNISKIDKLKEYDIDLILKYLENFLSISPEVGNDSKKFMDFKIERDVNRMSTIYQITWKKLDIEDV